MSQRDWPGWLVGGLLVLVAAGPRVAQAQTSADDADAAQRMERARRAADNPMKRIQEAARLAPTPARPVTVTVQVPAKAPAAVAAPVAARPVAPAPLVAPAPVALPATLADPPPMPPLALSAPALPPVEPPVTPPPAAVVVPTLLSMVEPELPVTFDPSAFGSQLRFLVRFSIRPDGQVGDVKVQAGPTDRGARNAVRQAVERWRYAPVSQEQPHEVELVLKLQG